MTGGRVCLNVHGIDTIAGFLDAPQEHKNTFQKDKS